MSFIRTVVQMFLNGAVFLVKKSRKPRDFSRGI